MSETVAQAVDALNTIADNIQATNAKLDDIQAALIAAKGAQIVTAEEWDALIAKVEAAKLASATLKADADSTPV